MSRGSTFTVKKNRIVEILVILCLVMLLGTQKLAFGVSKFEFSFAVVIFPAFLFCMAMVGAVSISKSRGRVLIVLFSLTILSSIINSYSCNVTSLLYFFYIYALLLFNIKVPETTRVRILATLRAFLSLAACIGILQVAVQLMGYSYFDLFNLFPNSWRLSGFNSDYLIKWGGGFQVYKANGWFFLEPSFFSQFMAIGIIIELQRKNIDKYTIARLVLYGAALVSSLSGTGIVLIIVCFVPSIRRMSCKSRWLVVLGFILAIFVLSRMQYSATMLGRIKEFGVAKSSASIRFINPYLIAFGEGYGRFFWGEGAGMADSLYASRIANHNAITKVMVEYGLAVLLAFLYYIKKIFLRFDISVYSVSLLVMFLFLAGNLLQPSIVFLLTIMIEASPVLNSDK